MSVHKSLRKKSSILFIDNARELVVFTRNTCTRLPKRTQRYYGDELVNLSNKVYESCKMANKIYPTNREEFMLRRKYFLEGRGYLDTFEGQIVILYEHLYSVGSFNKFKSSLKKFSELIKLEDSLIKGVMDSDKTRFKKMIKDSDNEELNSQEKELDNNCINDLSELNKYLENNNESHDVSSDSSCSEDFDSCNLSIEDLIK